mmetsp:Transcript_93822/g.265045  ORF Transcript_93822/g.265045 Transcript_93822/m.265045 type:complete len:203 (+) Transcript_93822:302-910(+)
MLTNASSLIFKLRACDVSKSTTVPFDTKKSRIWANARYVSTRGRMKSAPWWHPRITSNLTSQSSGNLGISGACTAMSGSGSCGYSTKTRPKLRTCDTSMAKLAFIWHAKSSLDIHTKLPGTGSKSKRFRTTSETSKSANSCAKYNPPMPPRLRPTKFSVTARLHSLNISTYLRTTWHCSLRPWAKIVPRKPCEWPQPWKQSL